VAWVRGLLSCAGRTGPRGLLPKAGPARSGQCFCPQCLKGGTVTVPETLLFVSTLDGNLHAVSRSTGDIKWTLKDGE